MPATTVKIAVERALAQGHFFVPPPRRLRVECSPGESIPWDVLGGHLLDERFARGRQTFDAWHVGFDGEAPLISIFHSGSAAELHVTRQIQVYAHEAYESTPGVIDTRPVQKWSRELVGSLLVKDRPDTDALAADLASLVFQAVVGTSRLPITSLESPLPAFSLGWLAYTPVALGGEFYTDAVAMLSVVLAQGSGESNRLEQAKSLEIALRSDADVSRIEAALLVSESAGVDAISQRDALFRTLFNHVALSPYTGFVDRWVALIERLAARSSADAIWAIDLLGLMLRQLCRHLTAFDLSLFHSFGANYPDALFLDTLLTACARLLDQHPSAFAGDAALARRRRRALRQAVLQWRQLEGLRVPDAPTSMGENLRVLPSPFERVPEEQIAEIGQRRKRLFAGESLEERFAPAVRAALAESFTDLAHETELRDLGTAVFHDRPLGIFLEPGAVDGTPLLSYEAFSALVAKRRLAACKSLSFITAELRQSLSARVDGLATLGAPVASLPGGERPGVVSLADARQAAPDYVYTRTARTSLAELLARYVWQPLADAFPQQAAFLLSREPILFIRDGQTDSATHHATLVVQDHAAQVRLRIAYGPRSATLKVIAARDPAGELVDAEIEIEAR